MPFYLEDLYYINLSMTQKHWSWLSRLFDLFLAAYWDIR